MEMDSLDLRVIEHSCDCIMAYHRLKMSRFQIRPFGHAVDFQDLKFHGCHSEITEIGKNGDLLLRNLKIFNVYLSWNTILRTTNSSSSLHLVFPMTREILFTHGLCLAFQPRFQRSKCHLNFSFARQRLVLLFVGKANTLNSKK